MVTRSSWCRLRFRRFTPEFLTVSETALFNACRKAAAVSNIHPEKLVLAADTLVSIDGETLGKPGDTMDGDVDAAFVECEHEVLTGVWLLRGNPRQSLGFVEKSRVRFRKVARAKFVNISSRSIRSTKRALTRAD